MSHLLPNVFSDEQDGSLLDDVGDWQSVLEERSSGHGESEVGDLEDAHVDPETPGPVPDSNHGQNHSLDEASTKRGREMVDAVVEDELVEEIVKRRRVQSVDPEAAVSASAAGEDVSPGDAGMDRSTLEAIGICRRWAVDLPEVMKDHFPHRVGEALKEVCDLVCTRMLDSTNRVEEDLHFLDLLCVPRLVTKKRGGSQEMHKVVKRINRVVQVMAMEGKSLLDCLYPNQAEALGKGMLGPLPHAGKKQKADQPDVESLLKANVKAANKVGMQGYLSKAMRALQSNGVAPPTAEVQKAMEKLHPQVDESSRLPQRPATKKVSIKASKQLLKHLRGMDNGSASGLSGWSGAMFKAVLSDAEQDRDWSNRILRGFALVMSRIANGEYDGLLKQVLLCPRLIPIWKEDEVTRLQQLAGGKQLAKLIRPIAVGELFDRATSLWLFHEVKDQVMQILKGTQWGCAARGGAELAYHIMCAGVTGEESKWGAVCFDQSNAFNTQSRATMLRRLYKHKALYVLFAYSDWAFGAPTIQLLDQFLVWSCTGTRQGNPLGPFLYCLSTVDELETVSKLGRVIAVMDDITIMAPPQQLVKACEKLTEEFEINHPSSHFNHSKLHVVWTHDDEVPVCLREYAQVYIDREDQSVERSVPRVLGAYVGKDEHEEATLMEAKVKDILLRAERLARPDMNTHLAHLLLKYCVVPQATYHQRTCGSRASEVLNIDLSMGMEAVASRVIFGAPHESVPQLPCGVLNPHDLLQLPCRLGGGGMGSIASTGPAKLGSLAFLFTVANMKEDPELALQVLSSQRYLDMFQFAVAVVSIGMEGLFKVGSVLHWLPKHLHKLFEETKRMCAVDSNLFPPEWYVDGGLMCEGSGGAYHPSVSGDDVEQWMQEAMVFYGENPGPLPPKQMQEEEIPSKVHPALKLQHRLTSWLQNVMLLISEVDATRGVLNHEGKSSDHPSLANITWSVAREKVERLRALRNSSSSRGANAWMSWIPRSSDLFMADGDFRTMMSLHCGYTPKSLSTQCNAEHCVRHNTHGRRPPDPKPWPFPDVFRHHLTCQSLCARERIVRHDAIEDIVADAAKEVGMQVAVQVTSKQSKKRPDIIASSKLNDIIDTHVVDVAVVEPTPAGHGSFSSAITRSEAQKRCNYKKEFKSVPGMPLKHCPFVLDSCGKLGKSAQEFLDRIFELVDTKRSVGQDCLSPKQFKRRLLHSLSVSLQSNNANMIHAAEFKNTAAERLNALKRMNYEVHGDLYPAPHAAKKKRRVTVQ